MNKLFYWVGFILGFLVGGCILAYYSNSITGEYSQSINQLELKVSLKDLELVNLNGDTVDINRLNNKKVLVNYWATWCKPCIEEFQNLNKFCNEETTIIVISGEPIEKIKEFKEKHNYSFIYLKSKEHLSNYGIIQIPQTSFYNNNFSLFKHELGGLSKREIEAILDDM